jgi:MFS transporter
MDCSRGSFTTSGNATGRPCDERHVTTIEPCVSSAIVPVQQKPCRLCADHEEADMTTGGAGEVRRLRRRAILRRDVIASNVSVFFALLIMGGSMFLSELYAQLLADTSPAMIGLLVAPCASMTVALAPIGGWLVDKVGPRALATTGLMTLTASVAISARWHMSSPASLVLWSNLIAGAGIGLATPALIRVSVESVGEEHAGLGAGLYKTVNELGGVFGVVLLGALLEARIVANALRQLPNHFLPQELSLKALTSLKVIESHALQTGLSFRTWRASIGRLSRRSSGDLPRPLDWRRCSRESG